MMRSLSSAVGGLRTHQTKMDVIGNNIANVNTYGFKSSRVSFSDVYYQTLSSGSAPMSETLGGTNPTQIGYGAKVATIDVMNTKSGMTATDRALDLYINGDGMIAVKDSDNNLRYTRLGIVGFDADGYLVDSNGNYVMGFPTDKEGNPQISPDGSCDIDDLQRIKIEKEYIDSLEDVHIETNGTIVGVLPGDTTMNLGKGVPEWLRGIILPEDTNLTGDISVKMEYQYEPNGLFNNAAWITAINADPNSNLGGTYRFEYDGDGTIKAINDTTGDILFGTYVRGGEIEMKRNGATVMTLTADAYNQPGTTAYNMGSITFTEKQVISYTARDKGGNTVTYSDVYNGYASSITLGDSKDPTRMITVQIDPSQVGTATEVVFRAKTGTDGIDNTKLDWLDAIYLKDGSTLPASAISLEYGREMAVKSNKVDSYSYQWISQFDKNEIAKLMQDISDALDEPGDFTLEVERENIAAPNATPDYEYKVIFKLNGNEVAYAAPDAPLEVKSNNAKVTAILDATPAATGVRELNVGNAFSLPEENNYTTENGNASSTDSLPLGTTTENDYIRIRDASGLILGEASYNSGKSTSISVGDFTLVIKPDILNDYFENDGTPSGLLPIGNIRHEEVEQWELDSRVGGVDTAAGAKLTIGVLVLANIPNMAAMTQAGDSYFTISANSGEPTFWRPGVGNVGSLVTGNLEMSNVDISQEFTDMITTQRGFQANSRIITVSDEMLQELVNLKR